MTTVLIADDSLVVRAFLKKQLGTEGYDLVEADSGEAALEACRTRPPDVVLLDVEMPGMSGYDVLAAMQADASLSSIPVIFLSGRVSASDVAAGLRLGAHDYLRKPVETGELVARVTKALQTKQMYARLQEESTPPPAGAPSPDEPGAEIAAAEPIDELTGALSVDGLQQQLRELAVAVRNGRSLAVVLVDVDDLGELNAAHGREAGDQVLRAVVQLVRERIGPRDVIGRSGDDEFLVLLPDADEGEAAGVAQGLRTAVTTSPALGAGAMGVSITLAVAATRTGDLKGLFTTVEQNMATAKRGAAPTAAPSAPAAPPSTFSRPAPPPPPVISPAGTSADPPAPSSTTPAAAEPEQRKRRWLRPGN